MGNKNMYTAKRNKNDEFYTQMKDIEKELINYSEQFENKVFHDDNLNLMRKMPDNSVDLIYCDILYGTGRDFGDYKDIKANKDEVDSFYTPRIKEMYRILKDTGSIYLHMDYRIEHWIRLIMDDVFGYQNFQNQIIWCYKSGGATKKRWSRKHDNILFYTKGKDYTFNPQKEKSYMYPWSGKNPAQTYYEDNKGTYTLVNTKDYWTDIGILATSSHERKNYPTQKPEELIEKIINASSSKGDIVADFFCGSGTTLSVAKKLGRKYIGCDTSEKAVAVAMDRVNKIK